MPLTRRHFHRCVLGGLAIVCLPSLAQVELKEGEDWRAIIPPQPTDTPDKIEVLEFFSYGCPHCGALNPLLKQWATHLPEDVVLQRVPVTFGRQAWATLARLFYTLQGLGALEQLDQEIFTAIHDQRLKLYQEPTLMEWLSARGIDQAAFKNAFASFDVHTKVKRSDYLAERYQIDAVPTITVAGRYAVLAGRARTLPELLGIAEQLIARARVEGSAQGGSFGGNL
ncbi:thiol:disulfide interchange protein DsbA/DsbL [Caldichromatium japonicum]|uniref:Thiol:disulfide interchange protein DsbA n=1 Tax=Caldichromatium japonicum TaxID=2699430 RepID=A0A6G7VF53_9GAMM|nr:thiol:disulfide interchange protein DsbA/DsbL [Caldichromatium japonicum]QIK38713.1 thiol:disulfide interchange protein DsbA/DsbL [Caldichromatium japonicum]